MHHEVRAELLERLSALVESAALDPAHDPKPFTIPASAYSKDQLERERAAIFRRLPVPVAHESEVAQPGDFTTCEVADVPILLVRGHDNVLRALVNVCRHRNALLAHSARGSGCKQFECPYHGWKYRLDGALEYAPGEAFIPDFDRDAMALTPLAVDVASGFIWVTPDTAGAGGALDMAAYLGQAGDEVHRLGVPSYQLLGKSQTVLTGNWKHLLEGFLDGWHLGGGHPSGEYPGVGHANSAPERQRKRPILVHDLLAPHLVRAVGAHENLTHELDKPPAERDLLACATLVYVVFPSTVLVVHGRMGASLVTAVPMSAQRTLCTHYMLAVGSSDLDSFALFDAPWFEGVITALARVSHQSERARVASPESLDTRPASAPVAAFHEHIERIAGVDADAGEA